MSLPEVFGEIQRIRDAPLNKPEVRELTCFDRRCIEETGFRIGKTYPLKETEAPYNETKVFGTVGIIVFDLMRLLKTEDACRKRLLGDRPGHEVFRAAGRGINPVFADVRRFQCLLGDRLPVWPISH